MKIISDIPIVLTQNAVDTQTMCKLLEWYISEGADCISVSCNALATTEQCLVAAKHITVRANGRIPVAIKLFRDCSANEFKLFSELNPHIIFLGTNLIKTQWEETLSALPTDAPLGIWEDERILTDDEFDFVVQSGRFSAFADSCGDVSVTKKRIEKTKCTSISFYDTNSFTLSEALLAGCDGYCGKMASIHPSLYKWLCQNTSDHRFGQLASYLSLTSASHTLSSVGVLHYLQKFSAVPLSTPEAVPAEAQIRYQAIFDITIQAHNLVHVPFRKYGDPIFVSFNNRDELIAEVDRDKDIYFGQVSGAMTKDEKTVFAVYPQCHGAGQFMLKKSCDGGKTWSERLEVPDSFSTAVEVPTMFRLEDKDGKSRFVIFTGRYPFRMSISEDDGKTFSSLKPLGDFGGNLITSVLSHGNGKYTAYFNDEGCYIKGGTDQKFVIFRAGKGGDKRTKAYTYSITNDGTYSPLPVPHPMNIYTSRPDDKWEQIYECFNTDCYGRGEELLTTYAITTEDGGLTWSTPTKVISQKEMHLCEICIIPSPDGTELLGLLRENSRKYNSQFILSRDNGKTWSEPKPVTDFLCGDRHIAKYLDDGRLFIIFRNRYKNSSMFGNWTAWVGSYSDIVNGKPGDCQVMLKESESWDCGYSLFEKFSDGSLLMASYGKWALTDYMGHQYVISLRIPAEDLEKLPKNNM